MPSLQKAARKEMNTALEDYKVNARKMNRTQRHARAKEIRAIAKRAGRVQEFKWAMEELAIQLTSPQR